MKRILGLLFGGVILFTGLAGAADAPFYDKVKSDQYSPRNDIIVLEFYNGEGTNHHQIWLVSSADPAKRHLLFTHDRYAEVLFSEDEEWLVINDHSGSSETELLLFHRKSGLEYEQIADLSDAAWDFFDQQNAPAKPHQFDHHYAEGLRWVDDDPPTLLVELHGHMDSRHNTQDWLCLYDVRAKKFSTDLIAHNKKMTKLDP